MSNTVEIALRVVGGAMVQSQLTAVKNALGTMAGAWQATAGVLVSAGVTQAIRSMLAAAEESRIATFQLQASLESAGAASESATAALVAQANALQSMTGVSDETVMSVQRMLLSMGATADQAERLTPLVLDVAAAMGTDATTAAKQLGSALDGQEITIGRLNIKVGSFEELLDVLNQRFRGQARALAEARGPMAQLSTTMGEIAEKMGALIALDANPLASELNKIVEAGDRLMGSSWVKSMGGLVPDWAAQSPARLMARGVRMAIEQISPPPAVAGAIATAGGVGRGAGVAFFDQDAADIEAERMRQMADASALVQVEGQLNNQYAFRRALIEQDPTMTQAAQHRALVSVLREELPVLEQRESLLRAEFDRAAMVDPNKTLETTIEAEGRLNGAMLERIQAEQELEALTKKGTFRGQMDKRADELAESYGNLAVSLANVSFDTVLAGVQGLGAALSSVIMGAKSAGEAFAQFGAQLLTNFISTILSAVLYAEVAIPILTALGVVSGGATAATGAAITATSLALGSAAASSAMSGGFAMGGYTGDGGVGEPAGLVHRREFVVPAWRTAEIGVSNLEAMTFGGGSAGGGNIQIRNIFVDNRRTADELARDPRFRNHIFDMTQG